MNYIKHMNQVFQKFCQDHRLNPNHISLYLALFQEWNANRFAKKTFISRREVMKKSKIRSRTTYNRCMTQLNNWGYIDYHPSRDAFRGSIVEMIKPEKLLKLDFETNGLEINRTPADGNTNSKTATKASSEKADLTRSATKEKASKVDSEPKDDQKLVHACSKDGQKMVQGCSQDDQKMIQGCLQHGQNLVQGCLQHDQKMVSNINKYKPINRNKHINSLVLGKPKSEQEVLDFFRFKKWKVVEGQKFYNHYQSIGWKKGGTTPLTDWQAAAESWVLRGAELRALKIPAIKTKNQDHLKTTKNKQYDEPL